METQPLAPAAAPVEPPPAAWRAEAAVLNPSYQDYVRGFAAKPAFGVPLAGVVFLLAVGALGLYWMISPIAAQLRWHNLMTAGMPTTATVTARTRERVYMGRGSYVTVHYMYYLYTVNTLGDVVNTYENQAHMPSSAGPAKGDIITIRYLPSDPGTSYYPGEEAPSGFAGLIQFLVGLFFLVVLVGTLGWAWWRWATLCLLARGGQMVPGTVAAVGPLHKTKRYYFATVTVTFTSPASGACLIGTEQVGGAGASSFPPVGQRVAVLYGSDTQFRLL
jgi:hypothetical protein